MRHAFRPFVALLCLLVAAQTAAAEDVRAGVRSQNFFHVGNAPGRSSLNAVGSAQKRRPRRKRVAAPRAATPTATPAATPQPPAPSLDGSKPARLPAGKSEDEAVAEAFAAALNEALRKPAAGETRLRAVLTHIECVPNGVVFVFDAGTRQMRLAARGFEGIHISAFTPEAGGEITCGPRKPESTAVVTYRPATDARAGTEGTVVAVEFVPATFQLKQ